MTAQLKNINGLISCACGCGAQIDQKNRWGYIRKYIHGHSSKGQKPPIMKGADNYNWKGGKSIHTSGYIEVLKPDHPNVMQRGYVFEHRLVMEQHLGRYLTKDEIIHHINGIKTDNRIENLQLMTKAEHLQYHMTIDMSGRMCSECGSDKTTLNSRGRPNWQHDSNGNLICCKCYRHQYWLKNRK